jgi:iron complex transport system ATP-binding protein
MALEEIEMPRRETQTPEPDVGMSATEAMYLSIEGLDVDLAKTPIVKNLSLQVGRGQFVGIIGPNGCGKTTLLKSIYKVLRPRKGTVLLETIDLINAHPRIVARHLGVVGQFNEVSFDFSVYEMVMMGRQPHKRPMEADTLQDHQITEYALQAVNLAHLAHRSFLTLSGGEKQRVILARAIAQKPHILILDEPTNHLDIKYQLQILRIVKGLGISVLAALHDLQLAAEHCDYLYVMKDGRVVADGVPGEVLTKALIDEVYDVHCEIFTNPVTGALGIAWLNA